MPTTADGVYPPPVQAVDAREHTGAVSGGAPTNICHSDAAAAMHTNSSARHLPPGTGDLAQRWAAGFLLGGWLTGCTIHDDQTQLTVPFPHGGSEVKLGCRVEPAGRMGTERSAGTGRGCGRAGAVRTAARRPSQHGRRASRRCRCEAPAAPPPQHPPASAPTGSSGTCAPHAPPPLTIVNHDS
eukprot:COSAG01_NODE_10086_length_2253_cov_1.677344_2_plen_184_part_00